MIGGSNRLAVSAGYAPLGAAPAAGMGVSDPAHAGALLHGIAAAIAVGVEGRLTGRTAAGVCVHLFLDAHASLDPLRGVKRNAATSLAATSRWLHANDGVADFVGLVLRGRQAHVFLAGRGGIHRLREGRITRLTPDQPTPALGADRDARVAYSLEPIHAADRFLLCSEAVQAALPDWRLEALLGGDASAAALAASVTKAAGIGDDAAAGIGDDALALVIDVVGLPDADPLGLREAVQALPIIPEPRPGAVIDRFRLQTILSDGQYSRVFRATDEIDGRIVIAKFPKNSVSAESALRQAFLREAWIAMRVSSPFLAEIIDVPDDRRTALYTVMPFYEGETLEQRLRRWPRPSRIEGLAIARKLTRAVSVLHRHHIIHRDIKPDNVVLTTDGGLRLLDFGVARLPNLQDLPGTDRPGTPSYMAPELLAGAEGNERTDIYALGVTIYRLFAGTYPYGEIEPFSRPRFARAPTPLSTLRPDLPAWLSHAVQRAVAVKPEERQADMLELLHVLEDTAGAPAPARISRSLLDRDPVLFWQIVSIALAAMLMLALVLHGNP